MLCPWPGCASGASIQHFIIQVRFMAFAAFPEDGIGAGGVSLGARGRGEIGRGAEKLSGGGERFCHGGRVLE